MFSTQAPTTGWDHWLRAVTEDRECLHPEVPRVRHEATGGSTNVRGGEADALERWAFAGDASAVAAFAVDDDRDAEAARVRDAPRLDAATAAAIDAIPAGATRLYVADLPRDHATLAKLLRLWHTEPRGYSRDGVLALRRRDGVVLLLADARRCPWLEPDERRDAPPPQSYAAAPRAGVSCDETCAATGRRCDPALLPFADDCAAVARHFDCPNGCGHQLGVELPALVTLDSEFTAGQCLIANGGAVPTCGAKHRATRRLCVCA